MLIFIDIETTGLEVDDKIVSIAMVVEDNENSFTQYELINEGKKIPPKASSIHHITNEMIKDKKSFKESEIYKFLLKNNKTNNTLVAHNAKFDIDKLLACGIIWQGEIIDTLRVTKHLVKECEFFSLQFLRYELQLYKNESKQLIAHNALDDALVVQHLYNYLLEIANKKTLITLSGQHVLQEKLDFGKYSGRFIEEIVMIDSAYLQWLLQNVLDLDEDLRYSIDYFLRGTY